MVRISAFGQTGPNRERPGFGRIAGAVSGVSYISGYPDRPPVSPGTPTIPDYLAGVMGALGALAAIESRHGTGLGQVVDVALYEPMLRMLDEMIPVHAALGRTSFPFRTPAAAPCGCPGSCPSSRGRRGVSRALAPRRWASTTRRSTAGARAHAGRPRRAREEGHRVNATRRRTI